MAQWPYRQALLAGARLIRSAPLAVLLWALLRIVEQYLSLAAILAFRNPGGLDPGAVLGVLVVLPFEAVLVSAVFRAHLRPACATSGFVRFGRTEAKMAGVMLLGAMAGLLIALPASIAASYAAYFMRQPGFGGQALSIGTAAAALGLMRLAPVPAVLVDEGHVDLRAAWNASRGRYWGLVLIALAAGMVERLLDEALRWGLLPPALDSWAALASPSRFVAIAWHGLVSVAALTALAGAVAVVWRSARQTVD